MFAAANAAVSELALHHLWLEELVSQDPNLTIEDANLHLERAESCLAALAGEEVDNSPCEPVTIDHAGVDAGLADAQILLAEIRALADIRLTATEPAGIGSELDNAFDALFEATIVSLRDLRSALKTAVVPLQAQVRWVQAMVLVLLVLFLLGVFLAIQRLEHRQAVLTERLGHATDRFRLMFNQHSAVMLVVDPSDGTIRDANAAATDFYGYDRTTLRSMRITDINCEPHQSMASVTAAAAKERSFFQFRHRLANRSIRDVEVHSSPISVDGDTVLYSIIHDVTERDELRREMEQLFELSIDLIGVCDTHLRLLAVNHAWENVLSFDFDTLRDATLVGMVHPDDLEYATASLRRIRAGERVSQAEIRCRQANGGYRWISWSGGRSEDRIFIVGRDMTGWRALLAAEQQERKRASQYFGIAQVAMLVVDANGRIAAANQKLEEVSGWTQKELDGREVVATLIPPDEQDRAAKHLSSLLSGNGNPGEATVYALVTRAGERRVVEWRNALLRTEDGRIIGCVSSGLDITEAMAAQAALTEAKERAEAASQAKSQFLAVMSHELRTPLNSVLGFAQLMQTISVQDQRDEYLAAIIDSGEQLLSLIGDILDLSHMDSGGLRLTPADTEIGDLARRTIESLRPRSALKGLSLDLEVEGAIPRLHLDPIRWRQILANLVTNAIKFTDSGGITVGLRFEPGTPTGVLHMKVSDTGIGIKPENLDIVFQPFVQADGSLARRHGGIGLGLTIVRRLVSAMGGDIRVDSRPQAGTTFDAALPCDIAVDLSAVVPDKPTASESEGRPMRLLIAEDHAINAAMLKSMAETVGHFAEVVEDGAQALEAVTNTRFDAVLMDVHMPVMDGLTSTRAIRALPQPDRREIPIVAVTANAVAEDQARFLNAGFSSILIKPVRIQALRTALDQYRGQQSNAP